MPLSPDEIMEIEKQLAANDYRRTVDRISSFTGGEQVVPLCPGEYRRHLHYGYEHYMDPQEAEAAGFKPYLGVEVERLPTDNTDYGLRRQLRFEWISIFANRDEDNVFAERLRNGLLNDLKRVTHSFETKLSDRGYQKHHQYINLFREPASPGMREGGYRIVVLFSERECHGLQLPSGIYIEFCRIWGDHGEYGSIAAGDPFK